MELRGTIVGPLDMKRISTSLLQNSEHMAHHASIRLTMLYSAMESNDPSLS
jgi:hypothetical protein